MYGLERQNCKGDERGSLAVLLFAERTGSHGLRSTRVFENRPGSPRKETGHGKDAFAIWCEVERDVSPARPYDCVPDLLGSDDLEEFDLEH